MPIVWINNPAEILFNIAEKRHPDLYITLNLVQGMLEKSENHSYGETLFPETDGPIEIQIDVEIPFIGFIDVLAHELAHACVGPGHDHDDVWEAEYTAINDEFNAEMERRLKGNIVLIAPEKML